VDGHLVVLDLLLEEAGQHDCGSAGFDQRMDVVDVPGER
jgi:hypothetical protein